MYLVKTYTEVYEDNYKQGELDHCTNDYNSYSIEANSPKEAIEQVITDHLYFSNNDLYIEDDIASFSTLVDADNMELNKKELGTLTAYSSTTTFEVYELIKREVNNV